MVGIIIVNWNGLKFLKPCLDDLFEQTYRDYKVYIVDNASRDGSLEYIKGLKQSVHLIENDVNKGFAEANNQAIKIALEDPETTHILCLNNDTIIPKDFLKKLMGAVEASSEEYGAWQGKVVTADEPRIFDSIGIEVYPNFNASQIGVGQIDDGQYQSSNVWGINAAAGLYSRKLVEDISANDEFFDNAFFAYLEDVDVAMRAHRRGWKAMYVEEAVINHIGSATSGKDSPFKWRLYSRNRWLFIYKNFTFKEMSRQFTTALESDLRLMVSFMIRRKPAIIWALIVGRIQGIGATPQVHKKRKLSLAKRRTDIAWWAPKRPNISDASGETVLSVVIPNWNGKHLLDDCLSSLRSQTLKNIQVIVVDNGSQDESVQFIRQHFPEVIVSSLPFNVGFAGGVNEGIKASTGRYIALLNNDAVADPRWAEELVAAMDVADIAAAKILQLNDPTKIDSVGDCMSKWGLAYPGGRDTDDTGSDDYREIFSASGGAVIYKRELLQKIGWFDSEFFAYYEDVDLSLRARLAGAKIILAPKATVRHAIGATSGKLSGFTQYHLTKNSQFVVYKNLPLPLLLKTLPRFLVVQVILLVSSTRKGFLGPVMKGYLVVLLSVPLTLIKRRKVQKLRVVSSAEVESWLTNQWPFKVTVGQGIKKLFSNKAS